MSKFKVGDRVRCVDAGRAASLVFGTEYTVSRVMDGYDARICVKGAVSDCDWWYADRFELIQQPVESPNDWVALPSDHVLRSTVDQYRTCLGEWKIVDSISGKPVSWLETKRARCRRRDYPQRPVEVHTGGPYVARSEYERVCLERDDALAQAARIRDEAVKLGQERDALQKQVEDLGRDVDILKGFNRDLKQHGTSFELLEKLKDTEDRLAAQSKDMIRMTENQDKVISNQRDRIADLIDRPGKEFRSSSKGWPLVPVDPLCIPEGHRAVEVTRNTGGKLVVSPKRTIFMYNREHDWPRLVVEPIPTPQSPDALPRPEFPAWIRAGWWMAMDAGGFWYMSEDEPIATKPVLGSTVDRGTWNPPNMDDIRLKDGVTASMKAVPCDRWREAKWQIE